MSFHFPVAALALSVILYWLYRRLTHISIAHIPGPKPESFLLGNLREFFQGQAAEADFKWQSEYGDIVRFKGPFGEDRLLVSDPKALQYIYQTSGYNFVKQVERRELSRIISGRGILWADGDDHRRHRKVMLPGFSGPVAKASVPLFFSYASKLTAKWRSIITSTTDQSAVLDMPSWVSRATLDAIGEVAFDYEFGAMDNADNALGKAYSGVMLDTFGTLTNGEIFSQNVMSYIPLRICELMTDYMPSNKLHHARTTAKIATGVAKTLVDSKSEALLQGKGNRDIMSLLVKANASENELTQLNEDEMLSQMRTIILAGHETTANTLSWMLLELAKRPVLQTELRNEIREMECTLQSRGDPEFKATDFDAMPCLSAVLKETLRYHPVAYNTYRQAIKDDVLPLSKPIITTSGDVLTELPIPKGLRVIASIGGYNRNKDIFGEDAHDFDPERWLKPGLKKATTSVGVLANLMSFSGGVRSCIGWKFAVLELQAFLVEMIGTFEFSLTPESQRIRREGALVMIPTVEGEVEKGAQLPLKVKLASREE
ncbi:cytochrome P450 [Collybia nuda]|uniref:Cytochrome P450 n=1 Tax=Collybia nuda TaxID=64659 RepID=A0A9P5Y6V8_9AGAR|nr:cytochrome P450 [Collybia nuda]